MGLRGDERIIRRRELRLTSGFNVANKALRKHVEKFIHRVNFAIGDGKFQKHLSGGKTYSQS